MYASDKDVRHSREVIVIQVGVWDNVEEASWLAE